MKIGYFDKASNTMLYIFIFIMNMAYLIRAKILLVFFNVKNKLPTYLIASILI